MIDTLVELLRLRAAANPHMVGYIFVEDGDAVEITLTYEALDRRARGIAVQLQRLGCCRERVMLFDHPGLDYIAAFFGCLYAGAVPVPSYPPLRGQMAEHAMAVAHDAGAKIVLANSEMLATLRRRNAALYIDFHHVASDDDTDASGWVTPAISATNLAYLQYTSGSTGAPKGVMVTHGNVMANLAAIARLIEADTTWQGVTWLPPYHDLGLIGGILTPLYTPFTGTILTPRHFVQRPMRWIEAMSRRGAVVTLAPNFAFDLVASRRDRSDISDLDLRHWRIAINGGERVRAATMKAFTRAFADAGFDGKAFRPCYGLAESTLLVTASRWNGETDDIDVGTPCGDTSVTIVDPESRMIAAPGKPGEIWIQGSGVTRGYWNRTSATAETFGAHLATGEGPFLRTGDIGHLQHGRLYVTGRAKDVIIIRGRKYHAEDVEEVIAGIDAMLRARPGAAFSVEVDDDERLVVIQEIADAAPPVGDLALRARKAIAAAYGIELHDLIFVRPSALPKTSSGKIRRSACRKLYLTNAFSDSIVAPAAARTIQSI
jgi:acyl-CoA synthetase (AMP-forming)/AMP-acid ligase II